MSSIRIVTNKPVAFDSPDHIRPWGTARDNSVNLAFNRKLLWLIPASRLRVLDLGCAGGGFVKSILAQGGFAVGIEGSDYSKLRKRAEWATICDYLFTADISEPFQLLHVDQNGQERPVQFSVVTAWEVMEHIGKDQLYKVAENMLRHLSPHGVVIVSVSPNEEIIQGVTLHRTVESRDWWISKLSEFGFSHHEQGLAYFGNDWVRGEDNAPGSFHLVMTRSGESLPFENRLRLLTLLVSPWDKVRSGGRRLGSQGRRILSRVTPLPIKRVCRRIRDRRRGTGSDSQVSEPSAG